MARSSSTNAESVLDDAFVLHLLGAALLAVQSEVAGVARAGELFLTPIGRRAVRSAVASVAVARKNAGDRDEVSGSPHGGV